MPTARNFFNEREQKLVMDAIEEAERKTSGEIRVHVENFCFSNEVSRAFRVFKKLKMNETKERNGILIYIAVMSRKVAIVGDQGIHEKLGKEYWDKLVGDLIKQFKENHKGEGLAASIIECGHQLSHYFPWNGDDQDELTNVISY